MWAFLWILTSFFIFLSGCATDPQNKHLAYQHFKMGVGDVLKGNHAKGLAELLKARELDSENPLILNHLGMAYYLMGEYEHAVVELENAIEENPKYSEAHNNIGRVYIDIKDFQKARVHLFKAAGDLTYQKKDKVWLNIGLSYFFENRFKKSQQYFLKSISKNRNNCLAHNYYGRTQVELEKFDRASKSLDQAIFHCRQSGFDEPHYYAAISLFRLGKKSKAIARLQEGRKLFPNGPNRKKMDEMIRLMKLTETK